MKHFALAAALLALAAAPARAQERAWDFKPGQTYTYELYTYYHYTVTALDRGMTNAGDGSDGETTKGGPTVPGEGGKKFPPEKGKPPCY